MGLRIVVDYIIGIFYLLDKFCPNLGYTEELGLRKSYIYLFIFYANSFDPVAVAAP